MIAVMSEHIAITPGTCGGKPRIAGHRIHVQDIAIEYEREGLTPDEIVDQHPSVTLADVHAALAYYYDHLEEIREHIRESASLSAQMAENTPSILKKKLAERNVRAHRISS